PFLLGLSGRGIEQSDLLKLGMEIYSYNDHRSAPFSRAGWLVLPPPTLTRVREPTLSWNQLHLACNRLNWRNIAITLIEGLRAVPVRVNKFNRLIATFDD